MRANTAEKWLEQRIKKYGPISKLSLFGKSQYSFMDRLQTNSYSLVIAPHFLTNKHSCSYHFRRTEHIGTEW